MKWKKEKVFRKRAAALVLSAAMAVTGGGFDQLQPVRAADDDGSRVLLSNCRVFSDSTCKDSTFYRVGFSNVLSGGYDKDHLVGKYGTDKEVYLCLINETFNDGSSRNMLNGFRNSDKGFRSSRYNWTDGNIAVCIEKTPGVYAAEITFEQKDGKKIVFRDKNNDFVLSLVTDSEENTAPASGHSRESMEGRAYVSKWVSQGDISIDAGGGTCSTKTIRGEYGKTITSLPDVSRKGYAFAGWYRDNRDMKDGVVTDAMTTGSSRVKSGDVYDGTYRTLYAGWRPYHYKISFHPGAGSGTMTEQEMTFGRKTKLSANAFSLDSYDFAGWNTEKDGSGTSYGDMDEVEDLCAEDGGSVNLYAQWKAVSYEVVYDANGGSGNTDPTSMKYGSGLGKETAGGTIAKNGFSRKGYTFDGWNTEPNGTGDSYREGQKLNEWTRKQKTTLYAQWRDNTYSVTYHSNAAGVTPPSDTAGGHSYGKRFSLADASQMTRTGYSFAGWNTKEDGSGTSYTDRQNVEGLTDEDGGSVDLYAQWKADTYTVVFDPAGGDIVSGKTAADARQEFTSGQSATLKIQDFFTKKGYAFNGWTCTKNGQPYGDGVSFQCAAAAGEEVRMQANWTPRTYKVVLKMSDSVTKTQNAVYDSESALVSKGDPAFASYVEQMNGYAFLGWSTKENASVAQYPDGASFKNLATGEEGDESITLYAVWKKNHSSIPCFYVYQDEDGNYPKDRSGYGLITGNSGDPVDYEDGLRPDTDLYEFDHCYAFDDSSERLVKASNEGIKMMVTLQGNNDEEGASARHLVYYYKRRSFTVTFENGTGIKGYSDMSIRGKGVEAVEENGATKVEIPYGSTLNFKAGAQKGYSLTSAAFGDTKGGTANALVSAPTGADGDAFWSLQMPAHDITIRANAVPVRYNIRFVQNVPKGSSVDAVYGSMPTMNSLAYDTVYTLDNCDILIPGWEFAGWNTEADGTGASYSNGQYVKGLTSEDGGTVSLYAQWRTAQYQLTFFTDAEGSTYQTKLYAEKNGVLHEAKNGTTTVDSLDIPKRAGYLFKGYAKADGSGKVVGEDGKFLAAGSQSAAWAATEGLNSGRAYYAVWEPVSYRIAFMSVEGDAATTMPEISLKSGQSVVLPPNIYTRKGYDFAGWSTRIYGGTGSSSFSDMDTVRDLAVDDNAVVTLYAQWKPHTYTIRFSGNGIGVRDDGGDYEISASYGEKVSLPLNTFKSRYSYLVFKGWNTDPNLETALYGNGASVRNLTEYDGDTVTLYAVWGYDDNAKYAVRTWTQTVAGAHAVKNFLNAFGEDDPVWGIDWGSIYNQENYTVKDTTVLSSRDEVFTAPEYDGFAASYRSEPSGADGIIYYDYYYDRNEYSLKVDGGASVVVPAATGSAITSAGVYFFGEKIRLLPDVPSGKHFGGWEVVSGDLSLKNSQKYDPELVLSMPASNVVLKALTSDVQLPVPTKDPQDPDGGSGVVKNLGDETVPEDGITISAVNDYLLIPEGVTLIHAESTNPSVAYVDSEGNLVLGKAGTAVITLETSEGTFVYTIHMTGADGVLEAGDVSSKYVKSVASVIKNGEIITLPVSEKVPVISAGTLGKSTSTNPDVAYVGEDGYLVFGRDGETVITTETSEGTIIYRVVIKDGKITIQSWKDENAEKPSGAPDTTQAPDATKAPDTTQAPDATKQPDATKAPDTTQAPDATKQPDATKAPDAAQTPGTAGTPAVPGTTQAPAGNVSAGTTDVITVDGLTYRVSGSKAQVTKAASSVKKASVKKTILIGGKNYTVSGVAAGAFKNCKKLSSVSFAGTSVSVGKNAFKNCKKLKTVSFAKAKTVKISKGAFAGCRKITFRTAKSRRTALKKTVKKSGLRKFAVK